MSVRKVKIEEVEEVDDRKARKQKEERRAEKERKKSEKENRGEKERRIQKENRVEKEGGVSSKSRREKRVKEEPLVELKRENQPEESRDSRLRQDAHTSSFRIPRVKPEPEDVKPAASLLTLAPTVEYSRSHAPSPSHVPSSRLGTDYGADAAPPYVPFSRVQSERGICQYWLGGCCPKSASECRFDHEGEVVKLFEKCKYYLSKECKKGRACPYLHEEFPCKKIHLLGSCHDSPCKFSHVTLTEQTRPLFEEEAIWWREETECAIEEEEEKLNEKAASNLRSLLSRIEEGMKKLELQVPEPPTPKPEEEINYNNFAAPNGKSSSLRYALNGTANLLSYAKDNTAKWEAYEKACNALAECERDEMERKYREIQERLEREAEEDECASRDSGWDDGENDEKYEPRRYWDDSPPKRNEPRKDRRDKHDDDRRESSRDRTERDGDRDERRRESDGRRREERERDGRKKGYEPREGERDRDGRKRESERRGRDGDGRKSQSRSERREERDRDGRKR